MDDGLRQLLSLIPGDFDPSCVLRSPYFGCLWQDCCTHRADTHTGQSCLKTSGVRSEAPKSKQAASPKCREPTVAFNTTNLGAPGSSTPGAFAVGEGSSRPVAFAVGEAVLWLGNQLDQLRTKHPSMEGAHHWRSSKSCPRGDIPAPWCSGRFGGSDGGSEGDAGLQGQPCSWHPPTLCSSHLHFGPQ